jgi:hypothetical protein
MIGTSLLTACLTVITGVTVLTLGRWVQTVILDPLNEYRKVVGKIQYNLWHFRSEYDFPWDVADYAEANVSAEYRAKLQRAAGRLHHCSSLLVASTNAIFAYDLWARAGWMPSRAEIKLAAFLLDHIAIECSEPSAVSLGGYGGGGRGHEERAPTAAHQRSAAWSGDGREGGAPVIVLRQPEGLAP